LAGGVEELFRSTKVGALPIGLWPKLFSVTSNATNAEPGFKGTDVRCLCAQRGVQPRGAYLSERCFICELPPTPRVLHPHVCLAAASCSPPASPPPRRCTTPSGRRRACTAGPLARQEPLNSKLFKKESSNFQTDASSTSSPATAIPVWKAGKNDNGIYSKIFALNEPPRE